jgi:hypothetical protein
MKTNYINTNREDSKVINTKREENKDINTLARIEINISKDQGLNDQRVDMSRCSESLY